MFHLFIFLSSFTSLFDLTILPLSLISFTLSLISFYCCSASNLYLPLLTSLLVLSFCNTLPVTKLLSPHVPLRVQTAPFSSVLLCLLLPSSLSRHSHCFTLQLFLLTSICLILSPRVPPRVPTLFHSTPSFFLILSVYPRASTALDLRVLPSITYILSAPPSQSVPPHLSPRVQTFPCSPTPRNQLAPFLRSVAPPSAPSPTSACQPTATRVLGQVQGSQQSRSEL